MQFAQHSKEVTIDLKKNNNNKRIKKGKRNAVMTQVMKKNRSNHWLLIDRLLIQKRIHTINWFWWYRRFFFSTAIELMHRSQNICKLLTNCATKYRNNYTNWPNLPFISLVATALFMVKTLIGVHIQEEQKKLVE